MYDVIIVIENKSDKDFIDFIEFKKDVCLTFLDISTKQDKSAAYKLKKNWGARKNPFVIVSKNDKVIKVFYSESGNAIDQFILWATEN